MALPATYDTNVPAELAAMQAALGIIPTEDLPRATSTSGMKVPGLEGVVPSFFDEDHFSALGGSASIPSGGPTSIEFFTDLFEYPAGNGAADGSIWAVETSGTGASFFAANPQVETVLGPRGARNLSTGTTTTGRAAYANANSFALASADHSFETCMKINNAVDGTETYELWFGYFASTSALISAQTDFAAFVYRWNGSAVELISSTRNASGTIQSTTLTAPAAAAIFTARVEIPASGNILFFINNVQVASHSTKPRTTGAGVVKSGVAMLKSAGTTARVVVVDYLLQRITGYR